MRILHTADWHLGRIFNKQYLTEDQHHILNQLENYLEQTPPDVLIIAGDIYDRSIPPEEAINLLDNFLNKVVLKLKIPTILLGGNHDGQERMSFGSRLMENAGLYVVGHATAEPVQICIHDEHGPVYFYPVPYATPITCRDLFPDEDIKTHHDGMARLVDAVKSIHPEKKRSVLISHSFVAGGEESDSERLLGVGGATVVSPRLFQGFDYVALGHLHRSQQVGAEHIRYSGSLLKYSFSETEHHKGMTLVELDAAGFTNHSQINFTPLREVKKIEGNFVELLEAGQIQPTHDYLQVTLLDKGAILDPLPRLREFYPNVLEVRRKIYADLDRPGSIKESNDFKLQSVEELFADFFSQVTDEVMSEDQVTAFAKAINEDKTTEEAN
ncbi:MAG: exonuclease SbcCD subunit D [Thermodesulfobacteriota bacterium]|nr:exonuclease SbcCD subunit D [Thermodesulfobacteriota bacterium]